MKAAFGGELPYGLADDVRGAVLLRRRAAQRLIAAQLCMYVEAEWCTGSC